jgi:hypothetical protein
MGKCAECRAACDSVPIVLKYADEKMEFCSFECLIANSVKRVCRRIARKNRRLQGYIRRQAVCEGIGARHTPKLHLDESISANAS